MKTHLFLVGILFPILCEAQSSDSTARSKLVTASPRLGGISLSYQVAPVNGDRANKCKLRHYH